MKLAVQLAELLGATTSTAATGGPMSFPQRHPLQGPGADTTYDYTLGLETGGAQASIVGPSLATITAERDIAKIGFNGIQGRRGWRQRRPRRRQQCRDHRGCRSEPAVNHRRGEAPVDAPTRDD